MMWLVLLPVVWSRCETFSFCFDITRYSAAYVTPKQTAPIVAKVLWENFFSKLWVAKEKFDRSRKEL